MRVPVFVHQFDNGYDGAPGGADDARLPISEVWGKTNDGLTWQARWDGHPAAIASLDAVVRAERELYAPHGIDYKPWGVVHGRWPGVEDCARREGRMAGEVARAAAGPGQRPVYIVDLEPHYHAPFPAFWRGDLGAGAGDIDDFCYGFTEALGGDPRAGELWLCPDAREPHLAAITFGRWRDKIEARRVLSQTYFTDFVRPRTATIEDARGALDAAVRVLGRYGWRADEVLPVLPGDAEPEVMARAVEHAHALGCGGVAVWQRGNLRADTAAAIAALADPWAAKAVPPAEEPPPVDAPQLPPASPAIDLPAALAHVRAARNALDSAEALLVRAGG